MTPTQAAVHHMLQRWYMADDLAQVAAMAEAAGVPIAGTRRLHLGAGPRFGEIEVIHHSTPGVGAGERGEGRGIVIDSAIDLVRVATIAGVVVAVMVVVAAFLPERWLP
jgi:hypothetical protein